MEERLRRKIQEERSNWWSRRKDLYMERKDAVRLNLDMQPVSCSAIQDWAVLQRCVSSHFGDAAREGVSLLHLVPDVTTASWTAKAVHKSKMQGNMCQIQTTSQWSTLRLEKEVQILVCCFDPPFPISSCPLLPSCSGPYTNGSCCQPTCSGGTPKGHCQVNWLEAHDSLSWQHFNLYSGSYQDWPP